MLEIILGPFFRKTYIVSEGLTQMELTLGDNQFTTAHLGAADKAGLGAPVVFNTPPTWSVDDSTIVSLTPSADGSSCVISSIKGAPKLGTAKVTVTDNDNPSVAVLEIDVTIQAEAVDHLTVTFDSPQEIDNTPPAPPVNPNAPV